VIQSSVSDVVDPALSPSVDQSYTNNFLFPVLVGNPKASSPNVNQWFNPAAYANPASGSFGNIQRNSLVGPGYSNVNLSIAKEFRLPWREGMNLEIRADAYDLFNHINYHNPDGNVGYGTSACPAGGPNAGLDLADCNAGKLTDSAGYAANTRVLQLGARFTF